MRSLRKGDSVVVMGRLTYREWDDPNGGGRRSRYEVDATSVGPDLSRYVAELSGPPASCPMSTRAGAGGGAGAEAWRRRG